MATSGIILVLILILIGLDSLGNRLLLHAQFIMHIGSKGYAVTRDAENEQENDDAMQHEGHSKNGIVQNVAHTMTANAG